MPDYDGIILGAGHNALILQACLGKAGLRTIAIERRHVAGGGLTTVEDPRHPGFLHNTHAFFQRDHHDAVACRAELARHGAHYIEPELNVALLPATAARSNGGRTSIDGTVVRGVQPENADALRRWQHEFVPILRDILPPESRSVPLPPDERRPARTQRCGPPPAGGQRAFAAGIRAAGVRASDRAGWTAVLQRPARGRPARARFRHHRGAAREPGESADVARRQRRRARAQAAVRERRRDRLMTEPAHRGGERPWTASRRGRRAHQRALVALAQSDPDLH